jgi:type II secretory pathway pseudopilin PulG
VSVCGLARARRRGNGFTLAAIVIAMAVMAIFLAVAVESVSFQKRRENEEELIFRGNQFVEAVRIFRARQGRFPLSLDELYKANPKVMRKKWVDPITGKADWSPVFLGQGQQIPVPGQTPGATPSPSPTPWSGTGPTPTPGPGTGGQRGGPIVGVASSSCDDSIKQLDGRTKYCEWKFIFDPNKQQKGGGNIPLPSPSPNPGK